MTITSDLRRLADEGAASVSSARLAIVTGKSKASVQRWGRSHTPVTLCSQYAATYSGGTFAFIEREGYKEPEPVVAPDWFELPTGLVEQESHSGFDVGSRRMLAYHFVQACIDGTIALAPWQRGAVWTEHQQVSLLDSMMRGLSIGALTMWHQPSDEPVAKDARPLPGCARPAHGYFGSQLIVDGQQRASTLVLAALGRLDHWRWNGREWTQGRGFLTPRLAVRGPTTMDTEEYMAWATLMFADQSGYNAAYRHFDAIERTDLDLMVLGGTSAEMVETYRRLATHGSPHSPEDLAVMERWLQNNDCVE